MPIRIPYKFHLFVSYDFHSYYRLEFDVMCSVQDINLSRFKKLVRRKCDTPIYYADNIHVQLFVTKGQCNASSNFAFHYGSDNVKK